MTSRSLDQATYESKLAEEVAVFKDQTDVNDLPAIFHYYTRNYLLPLLEASGYEESLDFLVKNVELAATRKSNVLVVSYGAGNCDLEVRAAERLALAGAREIRFLCVDINLDMLNRGRALAEESGLAARFEFEQADVVAALAHREVVDVHFVHQALHHFSELETIFAASITQWTPIRCSWCRIRSVETDT